MQIVVAPASTRTAAAAIQALLDRASADTTIKAYYRDLGRVPAEFRKHKALSPVQGDVSDPSTLDFAGADAVLAVTPPTFTGDMEAHALAVSHNVTEAAEKAGTVKKLVLLSSMGAELSSGVGEIKTNHIAERIFSKSHVPEIIFVRCAYFMENWTRNIDTLKGPEPFIISTVTPLDWKLPMVAVNDIGYALANELLKKSPSPAKPYVFELHGPQMYSPTDVHEAFCKALGRPVAVKPIQQDELHGFYSQIFPAESVDNWVEMTKSFLPGGVMAVDGIKWEERDVHRGDTDLATTVKRALSGAELDL
ncbi:putative nucleoside-diphosphate-sugar epimerase [Paramyrothecium foliicola]|nr:putative nucleoside-diphosphate-sugar epimerase [Paramyrothecium foliicola]